jgi:hypothetical protein
MVELYKPGEDTPVLTVLFKVSYPTTTILLSSSGKDEPEQEQSGVTEDEVQQPEAKEYAWVLVETVHETRQANIDNLNKGGVYQESASASPGSYTHTWKYVGESDDYPDPDMIHGESFATQLTITVPPAQIKGGETINLSFSLSFSEQNLSYFDGHGSARADWGNLRFANADGRYTFEIYSSVKYSEKNVSSVSDTISAVIPPVIQRETGKNCGQAITWYVLHI